MSQIRKPANHFSRRTFLQGSLTAGALFGLAACVPAQPPAQPVEMTDPSAVDTSGGTLRLAHNLNLSGRESLDPHIRDSFRAVNDLLYGRLTRYSVAGLDAELAESWEANEDGTEWIFHLRDGVTFHDGKPFTAQDVIYSFRRVADPELRSGLVTFLAPVDMDGLEALDDRTLRVPMTRPYADFPLVGPAGVPIIADGSGDTVATTGNGTGPFKLENLDVEGTSVLVANERYWGGPPKLARMEFSAIADGDARVNALLAGQIDYANIISQTQSPLIESNPDYIFEIASGPLDFSYFLVMHTQMAPFDDVRVRKAMKLVVDRALMLETAAQGNGQIAFDHLIYPGDPLAYTVEPAFDVEEAKALLAEAGYPDGFDVTLHTSSGFDLFMPIAITYKEMAAAAGINITIEDYPADSYWTQAFMQTPLFSSFTISPSTPVMLELAYRPDGFLNESLWESEEAVQLLDEAFAEMDAEKRADMYREVQRLAQEEGGHIVPFFAGVGRAFHKSVKGLTPNSAAIDWAQVYIDPSA
ncbi:MAG: twin-arginine translocation signal domain-containing protein [Caldilineaceae bacterium]|nr:twin-arginine translocation signal domain-containing protein [Caldilineaceae bacterium]